MVARKRERDFFERETISFMSHERVAPNPSRNASEARGGRRCARLRRAGEGAGESGEQRSGEGRGQQREHRAERQHRRWYCIALWESR